jgi:hypothetical protein
MPLNVIASEAKQSSSNAKSLDCFVARAPRNGELWRFRSPLNVIASRLNFTKKFKHDVGFAFPHSSSGRTHQHQRSRHVQNLPLPVV